MKYIYNFSLFCILLTLILASSCTQTKLKISKNLVPTIQKSETKTKSAPTTSAIIESEAIIEKAIIELTRTEKEEIPNAVDAETKKKVEELNIDSIGINGVYKIGVLYYLDNPAHQQKVIKWLADSDAQIAFHSPRFGYIDARIAQKNLKQLIESAEWLDHTALAKLELEWVTVTDLKKPTPESVETKHVPLAPAGYGSRLSEFREAVAKELNIDKESINGAGSTIAIFDGSFNLARVDIFQNRIKDLVLSSDANWFSATETLSEWMTRLQLKKVPHSLEQIQDNKTLRIASLSEQFFGEDINGEGSSNETVSLVVYENPKGNTRIRIAVGLGLNFSDETGDFAEMVKLGKPGLINTHNGKLYAPKSTLHIGQFVIGFKIEQSQDGMYKIAPLGNVYAKGATHGLQNAHAAAGRFSASGVNLDGIAPGANILLVRPWVDRYGKSWTELARAMIQSVELGADILDIDVFTPGARGWDDMLGTLLCRLTHLTDTVAVVAAHNYGPAPETVQNFAQSRCAISIGASHSGLASLQSSPPLDAGAVTPLFTAEYSGRGPGPKRSIKPDIISPALSFVAEGSDFNWFNGTSGATPVTAGSLALLKQLGKKIGLNKLDQLNAKYVLQSGSERPATHQYQDGYGYLNLLGSWNALKALKKSSDTPMEFYLSAPEDLFVTKNAAMSWLDLKRKRTGASPVDVLGNGIADNQIQEVSVRIDASQYLKPHLDKLVQFIDSPTPHRTIVQVPMFNKKTIRISYHLSQQIWDSLPMGYHFIVINGSRVSREIDGRGSEFSKLIQILKPYKSDQIEVTKKLKTSTAELITVESVPGQYFEFEMSATCDDGSAKIPMVRATVDNQKVTLHPYYVHNSYFSTLELNTRYLVRTEKKITNFSIIRKNDFCKTTSSVNVKIIRYNFDLILDDILKVTTKENTSGSATFKGIEAIARRFSKFDIEEVTLVAKKLSPAELTIKSHPDLRAAYLAVDENIMMGIGIATIDKTGANLSNTYSDRYYSRFSPGFIAINNQMTEEVSIKITPDTKWIKTFQLFPSPSMISLEFVNKNMVTVDVGAARSERVIQLDYVLIQKWIDSIQDKIGIDWSFSLKVELKASRPAGDSTLRYFGIHSSEGISVTKELSIPL